ncbi:mitochondrial biogenesis AIM24-domain-containing protein [Paraphysoderma sedebokerense]|nr:mitochondrial biogenesis AIM24-domain-containing protein [Paraphysoderma sedebokerense]
MPPPRIHTVFRVNSITSSFSPRFIPLSASLQSNRLQKFSYATLTPPSRPISDSESIPLSTSSSSNSPSPSSAPSRSSPSPSKSRSSSKNDNTPELINFDLDLTPLYTDTLLSHPSLRIDSGESKFLSKRLRKVVGLEKKVGEVEGVVVGGGLGSMLLAKMAPQSSFYSQTGTVIAADNEVSIGLTTDGGPFKTLMRKLTGGNVFYQSFTTKQEEGVVLLAPKQVGDVNIMKVENAREYFIRRHSFLACSNSVRLSLKVRELNLSPSPDIIYYKVTGSGFLALTTYGGLYKLALKENEKYSISVKHLIAWDSSMHVSSPDYPSIKPPASSPSVPPSPTTATATPPSTSPAESSIQATSIQSTIMARLNDAKSFVSSIPFANFTRTLGTRFGKKFKHWVVGESEMVTLVGPGEVWVASRILRGMGEGVRSTLSNSTSTSSDTLSSSTPVPSVVKFDSPTQQQPGSSATSPSPKIQKITAQSPSPSSSSVSLKEMDARLGPSSDPGMLGSSAWLGTKSVINKAVSGVVGAAREVMQKQK